MKIEEDQMEQIRWLRQRLRDQVAAGEQVDPKLSHQLDELTRATGAVEELGEELDAD